MIGTLSFSVETGTRKALRPPATRFETNVRSDVKPLHYRTLTLFSLRGGHKLISVYLRILVVLLLIPLTSCVPVEDFGLYWDRTTLDPRLSGKWKMIAASPEQTREHGYGIGDVSELVERDGAFELITDRLAREEDKRIWPVKTLITGRHRWLVLGREHALLLEYQFEGAYLDICPLTDNDAMAAFIRRTYSSVPNLEITSGMGTWVKITMFDSTAFALLRDYSGADHCAERTFAKFEKLR